jgi:pSer/pThr/pTyr-binding forkhead associated (FHA) protein
MVKETKQVRGQLDPSATVIYDTQPKRQRRDDADDRCSICLEVIGGPMDGEVRRIAKAIVTMGRSENNDFALPQDPMVSSTHARIVREGEHFWLEDLGSRNGTYFGDERLRARSLIAPGTTFVVGRTSLEFTPR